MVKIVALSDANSFGPPPSRRERIGQQPGQIGIVEHRREEQATHSAFLRSSGGARSGRRTRTGLLRYVARTGMVLALLTTFGAGLGFIQFVGAIERTPVTPGPADAIVALTGGAQRIGDAASLLASRHGRRLLISGVHPRTTREDLLRANPEIAPFVQCCVDLDYRARNTIGNAIETRRWVENNRFRSLIVVTSNYHMPRSLMELGHALPGTRLTPFAVVTDPEKLERWWLKPEMIRLLGSEYAKYVVSALRTRIERDPEGSQFATLIGGRKPSIRLPQDL